VTNLDDPPPITLPGMVVLVHGLWHGAWCWATLQAELDRRGVPSLAVDLPGHGASTAPAGGLHDDAAHVTAVLDQLHDAGHERIVLVGHSYGGAVITHAAAGRTDIDHLVYVTAIALYDGESVTSALGSFERRDVEANQAVVPNDDRTATTLDPERAPAALYDECPAASIRAALPRLCAQPVAAVREAAAGSPRDSIPSTYVVCGRDRAIHPDHQIEMARRCTHRVDIDTDHSPFISTPEALADVIQPLALAATETGA
jgi:pimeloyl-ACP methyl ester carboxylesterase